MVTYTKLKDGSWGIRVEGTKPVEGTSVTVTKKSGECKTEVIARVLWSDNKVSLCTIGQRNASSGMSPRRPGPTGARRSGCCSCGTPLQSWMDGYHAGLCHDCI